jgi:hypothetical protein
MSQFCEARSKFYVNLKSTKFAVKFENSGEAGEIRQGHTCHLYGQHLILPEILEVPCSGSFWNGVDHKP